MINTRRLAVSLGGAVLCVTLAGYVLGPRGLAAAAGSLLVVAWRHDNDAGTCLPLALLFLLTIAVVLLLFFMLITVRPH
jgi:hypothetical protein